MYCNVPDMYGLLYVAYFPNKKPLPQLASKFQRANYPFKIAQVLQPKPHLQTHDICFSRLMYFFVSSTLFSENPAQRTPKTGQNSEFAELWRPRGEAKIAEISPPWLAFRPHPITRLIFARGPPELKFSEQSFEFRIPIRQNHKVCSKLYLNPCFLGVFPPRQAIDICIV